MYLKRKKKTKGAIEWIRNSVIKSSQSKIYKARERYSSQMMHGLYYSCKSDELHQRPAFIAI